MNVALAFAAGASTSVGPCVAPRFVAIAALAATARRPAATIAAFVAGLVGAYALLGAGAATVAEIAALAPYLSVSLALALSGAGLWVVVRAGETHAHGACAPPGTRGLLRVSLLGASFALVVSPCCTPLILALTLGARGGSTHPALLLAAFACGHSAPILAYGVAGARLARVVADRSLRQAAAIVNGSLMFALGVYYAVLA